MHGMDPLDEIDYWRARAEAAESDDGYSATVLRIMRERDAAMTRAERAEEALVAVRRELGETAHTRDEIVEDDKLRRRQYRTEVQRLRAEISDMRSERATASANWERLQLDTANRLAAVTAARDEACAWLMESVAPSLDAERRISELRKAGSK